jgi:hypothetical protein
MVGPPRVTRTGLGVWGGAFDRLDAPTLRATVDDLGYSTLWLPETGGRDTCSTPTPPRPGAPSPASPDPRRPATS